MPNIRNMRDGYNEATGKPAPAPGVAAAPLTDMAGVTGYALSALNKETLLVSTAPEGSRNDTLNRAAFNMAQMVAAGQLPAGLVVSELTAAARLVGLDDAEILQTLRSGLPAGEKLPRNTPPVIVENTDWEDSLPDHKPVNVPRQPTTATLTAQPVTPGVVVPDGMFNRDVALEIHREHVRDAARRHLKAEREQGQDKPRMVGLRAFLDEPDEDVQYRVSELWPTGGRVVFAAQYKAGKSTAVGNVLRALADGTHFLDRFPTTPATNIVLIDNELDERTLRRWLRDQDIHNVDAVTLIPLRGKVSAFDIMDPETLAKWAAAMAGADVVVLDCLRPVLDALGLSEDKDAGRFLVAFDALLDQCGAGEALIVHHMGHNGERSRGDSRILDWPDATWRIIRQDTDDTASPRYFSAFGRDVEVRESRLEYDGLTRHLSLVGGSRKASVMDAMVARAVEVVATHRMLPKSKLKALIHGNSQMASNALDQAVTEGKLTMTMEGSAKLYDIPNPDQGELL